MSPVVTVKAQTVLRMNNYISSGMIWLVKFLLMSTMFSIYRLFRFLNALGSDVESRARAKPESDATDFNNSMCYCQNNFEDSAFLSGIVSLDREKTYVSIPDYWAHADG
jgi:hypothetical protein